MIERPESRAGCALVSGRKATGEGVERKPRIADSPPQQMILRFIN